MALIPFPPYTENKDLDTWTQAITEEVQQQGTSTLSTGTDNQDRPTVGATTLGYQHRYLWVRYATSADGSENFTNDYRTLNSAPVVYQGVSNAINDTESNNPADYTWREIFVSVDWMPNYRVIGGRQIDWIFLATTLDGFSIDTGDTIDLDDFSGSAGMDGTDGQSSRTDYAYSNSSNGATAFSTSYFTDALYIGIDIVNYTAGTTPPVQSTNNEDYVWARLRGEEGPAGFNTATVNIYIRSATQPTSTPIGDSTYTFADGGLVFTNANGWSATVDGTTGSEQLWIRSAQAISRTATTTIDAGDWSGVIQASATAIDGQDGLNQATLYLYQRNNSGTAPAAPNQASTYDFGTGIISVANNNGWTNNVPQSAVNPNLWVVAASAISRTNTAMVEADDWSAAALLAQDGADGTNGIDGAPGNSTFVAYADDYTPRVPGTDTNVATITTSQYDTSGGARAGGFGFRNNLDGTGNIGTVTNWSQVDGQVIVFDLNLPNIDTVLAASTDNLFVDINLGGATATAEISATASGQIGGDDTVRIRMGTITNINGQPNISDGAVSASFRFYHFIAEVPAVITNFSTVVLPTSRWIGIFSGQARPTDNNDYSWSEYVGTNGTNGLDGDDGFNSATPMIFKRATEVPPSTDLPAMIARYTFSTTQLRFQETPPGPGTTLGSTTNTGYQFSDTGLLTTFIVLDGDRVGDQVFIRITQSPIAELPVGDYLATVDTDQSTFSRFNAITDTGMVPVTLPTVTTSAGTGFSAEVFTVGVGAPTFTGTVSNGWHVRETDVPDGDGVIYSRADGVSSTNATIDIPVGNWSDAIQRQGADGISGTSAAAVDLTVDRNVIQNADGTWPTDPITVAAVFTIGTTESTTVASVDTINVDAGTGALTPATGNRFNVGITIGTTPYQYDVAYTDQNRAVTVTLETIQGIIIARDSITVEIAHTGEAGRGDVNNFIFIDVPADQTPTAPDDSPGVPTAAFVGTNAVSYFWMDSPPAAAAGIIWTSQGTQTAGEGDFSWSTPIRFTGVEGRSSRLDVAFFTNNPEEQTIAVTGTRSNVVGSGSQNTTAVLSLPSNFNTGRNFTQTSNSFSTSVTTVSLGNDLFIDIVEGDPFTQAEQAILAPANNSSLSNPATFSFNPGSITTVNWTGSTSSSLLGAYRLWDGSRIGGGQSGRGGTNNFPAGWAGGFDEGMINRDLTFSATNIPNPQSLPAGSTVGGVATINAGGVADTYAGGIQESTNNSIRVAAAYNRGRNPAYSGDPSANSFSQALRLLNSGATGVRAIVYGPNVTRNRRIVTLRNGGTGAVVVSGTIGDITISGTLQPGDSTSGAVFFTQRTHWNVSATGTVASWTFDPDIDNAFHPVTTIVTNRPFTENIAAAQALLEMGTIIRGLPNLDADTSVTVSGDQTILNVDLGSMLALRPEFSITIGNGRNLTPMSITVQGQSSYTITDYAGMVVDSFTSSVPRPFDTDRDFVVSRIIDAVDNNEENPVDFTALRRGSTLRFTATETGAVSGLWSISVNNSGAMGSDIGNIAFGTAAEVQVGGAPGTYSAASYPSGTIAAGDYMGANPAGHNHIGERLVFWGEGTGINEEPPVSTTPTDYAITRFIGG